MALPALVAFAAAGLGAYDLYRDGERKRDNQRLFDYFHAAIKHEENAERAILRDKRELLQSELRQAFSGKCSLEFFNQGSYAMQTGIVPLDRDFDIDVGVVLGCERQSFADAVEAKKLVKQVLQRGNRTVQIRRSCVTVQYSRDGRADYHVDLAIYVPRDDGLLDLAKGKEHSRPELRLWERADPKNLTRLICNPFKAEELAQFRRCVRYLKHWKQVNFSTRAPYSIALTVACLHWFRPKQTFFRGAPDDLSALRSTVDQMISKFEPTGRGAARRLKILLPVPPGTDVLAEVPQEQMNAFEEQLRRLSKALTAAEQSDDIFNLLGREFGEAFPVTAPRDALQAK